MGHKWRQEALRLRPGTWRLRAFWRLHVGVALAFGLFSSGLAALVALTLFTDARGPGVAFTGSAPVRRVQAWGSGA